MVQLQFAKLAILHLKTNCKVIKKNKYSEFTIWFDGIFFHVVWKGLEYSYSCLIYVFNLWHMETY